MIQYETIPFEYHLRVRAFPLELCTDEGTGAYGREKHSRASKQHPRAMIPTDVTGTCQHPISCWASQHPELEGGWTVQAEHGQGPSSLWGDPVGVESNQHPRQFECHLLAQAFRLSKSLPASPRLFPL